MAEDSAQPEAESPTVDGAEPAPPTDMQTVQPDAARRAPQGDIQLVADVPVTLTAHLGGTSMLVGDIMELDRGAVIELDRAPGDPIDVLANGELIARGEVIVVDDRFGVRLTALISGNEAASAGDPAHNRRHKESRQ